MKPTAAARSSDDDDHVVSDRQLLAAHVAGDAAAFTELDRRYRQRLYALGVRLLRDRDEAADAVQDALLRAHRSADTYRGDSAVAAWLHRIMTNGCLTRLRARRPVVPLEDDDDAAWRMPRDPGRDAFDEVDDQLAIRAFLEALPDEQRLAVLLVDVYGYPVEEVAAQLGIPTGTVKSRCARGRARLAAILQRQHAFAGDRRYRPTARTPAPTLSSADTPAPDSDTTGKGRDERP